MDIKAAYNDWAAIYDSNANKTRDLEATALKDTVASINFNSCLEIGCGTGKNTSTLLARSTTITAVDFSEKMLQQAKVKYRGSNVTFILADVLQAWTFTNSTFDLVVFSLILEHIKDIGAMFQKAYQVLNTGGMLYFGEYHPFKQYAGKKARFQSAAGIRELTTYTHHVSEYVQAALSNNFSIVNIQEYFDADDTAKVSPRIFSMLLRK